MQQLQHGQNLQLLCCLSKPCTHRPQPPPAAPAATPQLRAPPAAAAAPSSCRLLAAKPGLLLRSALAAAPTRQGVTPGRQSRLRPPRLRRKPAHSTDSTRRRRQHSSGTPACCLTAAGRHSQHLLVRCAMQQELHAHGRRCTSRVRHSQTLVLTNNSMRCSPPWRSIIANGASPLATAQPCRWHAAAAKATARSLLHQTTQAKPDNKSNFHSHILSKPASAQQQYAQTRAPPRPAAPRGPCCTGWSGL